MTSPLEAPSQESSSLGQTEVFGEQTSQGEVRFEELTTPNPHQKRAWGRSTPMYLGKYAFPLF